MRGCRNALAENVSSVRAIRGDRCFVSGGLRQRLQSPRVVDAQAVHPAQLRTQLREQIANSVRKRLAAGQRHDTQKRTQHANERRQSAACKDELEH